MDYRFRLVILGMRKFESSWTSRNAVFVESGPIRSFRQREGNARAAVLQSKPGATSRARPRVLIRSRSLALPLGDLDLSLPSDRAESGSRNATPAQAGSRKDPKKPMRRQKSMAELFGVVIYKSKVQLQELFSRRDKDTTRNRKDASPLHGMPQAADPGATGGPEEQGPESRLKSSPEVAGAAGPVTPGSFPEGGCGRRGSQLLERMTPVSRLCHPSSGLDQRSTSTGGLSARTPAELFCVTPNSAERPVSTRSLDTIHGEKLRKSSDSNIVSPSNADRLLKPNTGFKAKAALVKCKSDSIYRLVLPLPGADEAAPLTKASSDDACFTRRRHSPQLLPRDRSVDFSTRSQSSGCSPQTSRESWSCVSSIVDWLLVGSVEAAYNEPLLCSLNVEAVVDITNVAPQRVPAEKKTSCPCTCSKKHFRSKLNLAVDDIEWENIEQHFTDINAFINGWRQRGKRVLVVSYHGRSRAPAVAVQHLMTHYRIPLQRALAHVRARRLQTRINPGFLKALQRVESRVAKEDATCCPSPPVSDLALTSPRTAWDEC
ncbi:hypothetical protein ACOMHN_006822 [Nucella lapillus]